MLEWRSPELYLILLPMDKPTLKQLLFGEFSPIRLLRSAIFIYACICLYAFLFADHTIFQPPPSSYQDTSEIIKLESAENIKISALYLANPEANYTILYSHGNAEDLGDIKPILNQLQVLGFAVLAYDYRGYGTSTGRSSEHGAYEDINAAYNYLTQQLNIPPSKIIAYGRSVGGGPAIDLASREPLGGLVVESTFTTAFRVITRIQLLPFEKFANIDKIKKVHCPVLVIHGTIDRVIPFVHGQKLYEAANEPKRFLEVEGADHNDLVLVANQEYGKTLQAFAQLIANQ